jgi:hypothetical protein
MEKKWVGSFWQFLRNRPIVQILFGFSFKLIVFNAKFAQIWHDFDTRWLKIGMEIFYTDSVHHYSALWAKIMKILTNFFLIKINFFLVFWSKSISDSG